MSYPERLDYAPLSVERYVSLLIDLLDQLPELLKEIAPTGFGNSIYHYVFYGGPEQAYNRYKLEQIKKNLSSGCKYNLGEDPDPAFLSKAEFLKNYTAPPPDLELEALAVYISALSHVFDTLSIIHDREGNAFNLTAAFKNCIYVAQSLTIGVNRFYTMQQIFPDYIYEQVDLQPLYRFIFRLLSAWGYDYHYQSYREEFKTKWEEIINSCPEDVKSYMHTHEAMELIDAPPVIAAYLDVYGHWPEGYL